MEMEWRWGGSDGVQSVKYKQGAIGLALKSILLFRSRSEVILKLTVLSHGSFFQY
jgi:hypothetical protein